MIRDCDNCSVQYKADNRNIKRGWGLCCSKKCAAEKREKSKKGYNINNVIKNNAQRKAYDVWLSLSLKQKQNLIDEEKLNMRDKRLDHLLK